MRVLGGGPERRVESVAGELKVTGPPKVERLPDPTLFVGDRVVEYDGRALPRGHRRADRLPGRRGACTTRRWYTDYRSEKKIVRVGTKPRPVTASADAS